MNEILNKCKNFVQLRNIQYYIFIPYIISSFVILLKFIGTTPEWGTGDYLGIMLHERLYYIIVLTLFPILILSHSVNKEIKDATIRITDVLITKFRKDKILLYYFIIYAISFLILSNLQIPTMVSRGLRFSGSNVSVFTPDPPFPHNLSYFINSFIPVGLVTPIINIAVIFLWFLFLTYINGDRKVIILILGFSLAFCNFRTIFYSLSANYEITVAIFSMIGLYGFYRRNYSIGITFVLYGMLFKSSSLFFPIISLLFYIEHYVTNKGKIKLSVSYLSLCISFVILNYVFFIKYLFERISGEAYGYTNVPWYYIFSQTGNSLFFSAFHSFVIEFINYFLFLLIFGMIGLFNRKYIKFNVIGVIFLFLIRCFSRLSINYYTMFFIPVLSYLAVEGIYIIENRLFKNNNLYQSFIRIILSIAIIFSFVNNFSILAQTKVLNYVNVNWGKITNELALTLPQNSMIYERRISLYPYLSSVGRNDLKYEHYPENNKRLLSKLNQSGPILVIGEVNDQSVSNNQLIDMGYRKLFIFGPDKDKKFRIFLKS